MLLVGVGMGRKACSFREIQDRAKKKKVFSPVAYSGTSQQKNRGFRWDVLGPIGVLKGSFPGILSNTI